MKDGNEIRVGADCSGVGLEPVVAQAAHGLAEDGGHPYRMHH